MFGIGETELVIIVVFAFLLFGPDKLPGMGRTLGRVLRQFREASDGFTEVVQTNIMDPASEELEKSPKQRKREQEVAEGADGAGSDAVQETPAAKRETFAERKARLMAERKAAEEAAAASSEDARSTDVPAAESEAAVPDREEQQDDDAASSTTSRPSAADLYARTGQRSSRSRAKESVEVEQNEASDAQNSDVAEAVKQGEEVGEA